MTRHRANTEVDPVATARAAARELCHTTMRLGRDVECWRCDLKGSVGDDGTRVGDIFAKECQR